MRRGEAVSAAGDKCLAIAASNYCLAIAASNYGLAIAERARGWAERGGSGGAPRCDGSGGKCLAIAGGSTERFLDEGRDCGSVGDADGDER